MRSYKNSILLLDDDKDFLESYKKVIESTIDYQVDTAENPEELLALLMAKPGKHTFILLDHNLDYSDKKIDSTTLIPYIKEIDAHIPIILFSGKGEGMNFEQARWDAVDKGAVDLILKNSPAEIQKEFGNIKKYIDSLKEIEEQLRYFHDQRKWLHTTITGKPIDLAIIDQQYRVLYMNKSKENLLDNRRKKHNLCWALFADYPVAHGPCDVCMVKNLFDNKGETHSLYFNHKFEGRYYLTTATPLKEDEEGKPLLIVEVGIKLTGKEVKKLLPEERLRAVLNTVKEEWQEVTLFLLKEKAPIKLQASLTGYLIQIEQEHRIRQNEYEIKKASEIFGYLQLENSRGETVDSFTERIPVYIKELSRILSGSWEGSTEALEHINAEMKVDLGLILAKDPKEGLARLAEQAMESIIELSDIQIRLLKGKSLELIQSHLPVPQSLATIGLYHPFHFDARPAKNKKMHFIPDIRDDSDYEQLVSFYFHEQLNNLKSLKSAFLFPLIYEGHLIGTAGFYFRIEVKRQSYAGQLETIIKKITILLWDYQSWESWQEESSKNETMLTLSGTKKEITIEEYTRKACHVIKKSLKADICSIYIWDREWGRLRMRASTCTDNIPDLYYDKTPGYMWDSYISGSPYMGEWEPAQENRRMKKLIEGFYRYYQHFVPKDVLLVPIRTWEPRLPKQKVDFHFGMIELIKNSKDDPGEEGFTEADRDQLENMASFVSFWMANYMAKADIKKVNRMQKLLLDINGEVAQTEDIEKIYYLFFLAITHNDGLKFNRVFLVLPAPWENGELKVVAALGINDESEKKEKWENVKDMKTILAEYRTSGIPPGALWPRERLPRFTETSFLCEEIEKSPDGIRVFGHLQESDPCFKEKLQNDIFLQDIKYTNEITCVTINLTIDQKQKGFLIVDNYFNNRRITPIDMSLLIQYANSMTAALYKHRSTETSKRFSAEIAHEIKNAFQSVINYSELIRKRSGDINEWIKRIESQSRYSESTAAILLESIRLEQPEWKLERSEIKIHVLIKEAIESVEAAAWKEDLSIDFKLNTEFILWGDSHKLRMVLVNVLNNAIKALNKKKAPERRIIEVRGLQENARIIIQIRDRGKGKGMNEEQIANIKKPFYGEGTGLGLYLSDTIVRKHQGKIEIQSTEGAGTTVTIELPKE